MRSVSVSLCLLQLRVSLSPGFQGRFFPSLIKFIPKYFILFDAILNGIVLISVSDSSLSAYRNANEFSVLIFFFLSCNFPQLVQEEEMMLSRIRLFGTPRAVACQAPLSMGFTRQEYWVGSHSLLQGIFLTQGWNLGLLHCRWILYRLSHQGSPPCPKEMRLSQRCLPPLFMAAKTRSPTIEPRVHRRLF